MPVIQPFESQAGAPSVTNFSRANPEAYGEVQGQREAQTAEALGQAGGSVEKLGAVIEQRQGEAEVSDLAVKMAQLHSDYTNNLAETLKNADPGDATIHDKFMEDYNDSAQEISDQIKTRAGKEYFARQNARLVNHFSASAAAGQSELAGVQAKDNFQKVLQTYSATLQNDPASYWTTVKAMQDENVQSLKGRVNAETLLKLKDYGQKTLAESAVRGFILANPTDAKAQLDKGVWDKELTTDQKHQLIGESRVQIHANLADQELQRRLQDEALADEQRATENKFLNKLYDPKNNGGMLTSKQILTSNLEPAQKRLYQNILEGQAENGENPKNPALFNDTLRRINLPSSDPRKLTDENTIMGFVSDGKMPYADAIKLRTELQGRKTEQGQLEADLKHNFLNEVAKSRITKSNPGLGMLDVEGDNRLYQFTYLVDKAIESQKKAGRPVQDLFNPQSKDYLEQYITPFIVKPQEVFDQFTRAMSAQQARKAPKDVPKRLPGETTEQYKARNPKLFEGK